MKTDIIVLLRMIEFVFGDGTMAVIHTPEFDLKLEKTTKGEGYEADRKMRGVRKGKETYQTPLLSKKHPQELS